MVAQSDMADRCRHLRARAPEEWNEFVKMMIEYTEETVYAVTEADAAEIMTMKGRAQACIGLTQLFTNLDKPGSAQQGTPTPGTP